MIESLALLLAVIATVAALLAHRRAGRFELRLDAIREYATALPPEPPPRGRRTRTGHLHVVRGVKGVAA